MAKTTSMIGVAVIGLGNAGTMHALALKELERDTGRVRLMAVASQTWDRAREIGETLNVKYSVSIDDIVRDPNIDVVTIATPTYLHGPQALYAIEHGKQVIVEKPLANTLSGAREVVQRARKMGVKLGVVFQERYAPHVRLLKNLIDDGVLGNVFLIEGEMKRWRGEDYYLKTASARSWRGLWGTEGGGAIMNQGIHTVDLLTWFGGPISEVSAFVDNMLHPYITVEDTGVAIFRYDKGALGTLSMTTSVNPPEAQYRKIRVHGSNGSAELTNLKLTSLNVKNESKTLYEIQTSEVRPLDLYKSLFMDFINAVEKDEDFPISGEEGLRSLEVIKAIYLSSLTRKIVKLPLELNGII